MGPETDFVGSIPVMINYYSGNSREHSKWDPKKGLCCEQPGDTDCPKSATHPEKGLSGWPGGYLGCTMASGRFSHHCEVSTNTPADAKPGECYSYFSPAIGHGNVTKGKDFETAYCLCKENDCFVQRHETPSDGNFYCRDRKCAPWA